MATKHYPHRCPSCSYPHANSFWRICPFCSYDKSSDVGVLKKQAELIRDLNAELALMDLEEQKYYERSWDRPDIFTRGPKE